MTLLGRKIFEEAMSGENPHLVQLLVKGFFFIMKTNLCRKQINTFGSPSKEKHFIAFCTHQQT